MKALNVVLLLCILGVFSLPLAGCSFAHNAPGFTGFTKQSAGRQAAEKTTSEPEIMLKAQLALLQECGDKGLSHVMDFCSPKCDRINPVGGNVARIVTTEYDDADPFWRVVFHLDDSTDNDSRVYFFDKNGTYVGAGWID